MNANSTHLRCKDVTSYFELTGKITRSDFPELEKRNQDFIIFSNKNTLVVEK